MAKLDKPEATPRLARARVQEILASGADPLRHTRDFTLLWFESDYSAELGNAIRPFLSLPGWLGLSFLFSPPTLDGKLSLQ